MDDLPITIIEEVIKHLDDKSIQSLSLTNRQLKWVTSCLNKGCNECKDANRICIKKKCAHCSDFTCISFGIKRSSVWIDSVSTIYLDQSRTIKDHSYYCRKHGICGICDSLITDYSKRSWCLWCDKVICGIHPCYHTYCKRNCYHFLCNDCNKIKCIKCNQNKINTWSTYNRGCRRCGTYKCSACVTSQPFKCPKCYQFF